MDNGRNLNLQQCDPSLSSATGDVYHHATDTVLSDASQASSELND
jgi:hypothetical protein